MPHIIVQKAEQEISNSLQCLDLQTIRLKGNFIQHPLKNKFSKEPFHKVLVYTIMKIPKLYDSGLSGFVYTMKISVVQNPIDFNYMDKQLKYSLK